MNAEKLKKLQEEVRIGGKGTQRRKKKYVHSNPASDDKKLKQTLKKLSLNVLPGIEEVNVIKTDGTVLQIRHPKVHGAAPINTFTITGTAVEKTIAEMLPEILPQLGSKNLDALKSNFMTLDAAPIGSNDEIRTQVFEKGGASQKDDDVLELVDNFEMITLSEEKAEKAGKTEKVESAGKTEKAEKNEKAENDKKSDNGEKNEKAEENDNVMAEKAEVAEKTEKVAKNETTEKTEKAGKTGKVDKTE